MLDGQGVPEGEPEAAVISGRKPFEFARMRVLRYAALYRQYLPSVLCVFVVCMRLWCVCCVCCVCVLCVSCSQCIKGFVLAVLGFLAVN